MWKNDKKNGYGKFDYNNGDIYKGEWVNDKKNGKGVYIKKNGNKFSGIWKNNQLIEGFEE